jgi:hypothetical protein
MAVGSGGGGEGGRSHGLEAKQLGSARKPSKSPAPQVGRRRSERTGHSKTAAKTDAVNRPKTSANNPRPHLPLQAMSGGVKGGGGYSHSMILSAAGERPSSGSIAERANEREVEGNNGRELNCLKDLDKGVKVSETHSHSENSKNAAGWQTHTVLDVHNSVGHDDSHDEHRVSQPSGRVRCATTQADEMDEGEVRQDVRVETQLARRCVRLQAQAFFSWQQTAGIRV